MPFAVAALCIHHKLHRTAEVDGVLGGEGIPFHGTRLLVGQHTGIANGHQHGIDPRTIGQRVTVLYDQVPLVDVHGERGGIQRYGISAVTAVGGLCMDGTLEGTQFETGDVATVIYRDLIIIAQARCQKGQRHEHEGKGRKKFVQIHHCNF